MPWNDDSNPGPWSSPSKGDKTGSERPVGHHPAEPGAGAKVGEPSNADTPRKGPWDVPGADVADQGRPERAIDPKRRTRLQLHLGGVRPGERAPSPPGRPKVTKTPEIGTGEAKATEAKATGDKATGDRATGDRAAEDKGPWGNLDDEPSRASWRSAGIKPRLLKRLSRRSADTDNADSKTPGAGRSPARAGKASAQNNARPKPARNAPGARAGGGMQTYGPGLDELTRSLRDRLKDTLSARRGRGVRLGLMALVPALIIGAWAASGFYVVQPDQQGVVTRFGSFAGLTGPGLNYHLPAPIESARRISGGLRRLDVGAAAADGTAADGVMITGDDQLVDMDVSIEWRIENPAKFLFRGADPQATLKLASEAAIREIVGRTPLPVILSTGRYQVQTEIYNRLQRSLMAYALGVKIVGVHIRAAGPPPQVAALSQDIVGAGSDAAAAVNQAEVYRSQVIAAARGEAAKTVQDAEGEREQHVRVAGGEASHFAQVDAGYKAAPALTRQRIYLDTMRWVLSHSNKVVVDVGKGGAPIMLPPEVFKARRSASPNVPTAAAAQNVPAQIPTRTDGKAHDPQSPRVQDQTFQGQNIRGQGR